MASIVCPTSVFGAWSHLFASFACNQICMIADVQNVLAEHELFDKFGGGETSKQGQAVETISCQANTVGQFRRAFTHMSLNSYHIKDGKLQKI